MLFKSIINIVQEVENFGIFIVTLSPESIYVKENDNSVVKFILTKNSVDLSSAHYNTLFPEVDDIKYLPPE